MDGDQLRRAGVGYHKEGWFLGGRVETGEHVQRDVSIAVRENRDLA